MLNVLALAQDMKRFAKPDKAVLLRKTAPKGEVQQIPVDISKILKHQMADVVVKPNDVLFVPESSGKRAMSRGFEAAMQIATGVVLLGR